MEVITGLDRVRTNRKYDVYGIIRSKRRACKNIEIVGTDELAECVGNKGMSFVPCILKGGMKTENCIGAQLFVLDFDNDDKVSNKVSFDDIKYRCDMWGIAINFAYHTFNSSDELEKFRVILAHESFIDDPYIVKVVYAMLMIIFPECDPHCKNLDRVFLGGKDLIYSNSEAHFALVQLLSPFYDALKRNKNSLRDLRRFCNTNKILMLDNKKPAMERGEYLQTVVSEYDGILENTILHYIGDSKNPSFFIFEWSNLYQSIKRDASDIQTKKIDLTKCSGCQLFKDFISNIDIGHAARFAILTNLVHVNGGRKFFFEVLKEAYDPSDPERYNEWQRQVEYIDKNYNPQRCSDSFCPYYKLCKNNGTILDTLKADKDIRCLSEEIYYSIQEAEENLKENIEEAMKSPKKCLHLIKAQTGIGKTYAYERYIAEDYKNRYIVASPTNILKDEIYHDLLGFVPESEMHRTSSVSDEHSLLPAKLREDMRELYDSGIYDKPKELLKEYREEIANNPSMIAVVEECDRILEGMDNIQDQRIIITTHAYMLQLPESLLQNFIIIVDEDILELFFLKQIKQISIGLLSEVSGKNISYYSELARKIMDAPMDRYERLNPSPYTAPLTVETLEEYGLWSDKDNDLNDLRNAVSFVKKEENGETIVLYFCPPKLHEGLKYVVLSATLDEDIYSLFFKNMEITIYEQIKAEYIGKIEQYAYHSMSRANLKDKLEVFDFVREISGNEEIPIITFVKYEYLAKGYNKGIHFGNEMGINYFKGKDIAVIGTYYLREEEYKLPACFLGADINNKTDISPRPRRVEHGGKSFVFTTYSDPILQKLQLYMINSSLEQSVGRARLLRYDCTVYVFSNFPCEQANIHTENYLLEY